jgi:hypothetical protein
MPHRPLRAFPAAKLAPAVRLDHGQARVTLREAALHLGELGRMRRGKIVLFVRVLREVVELDLALLELDDLERALDERATRRVAREIDIFLKEAGAS